MFDPVPLLIVANWHMCDPHKNYGLLMPKALFHLVEIGWLMFAEVGQHFSPVEFAMLKEYNDLLDKWQYLFVVLAYKYMSTSWYVWICWRAGLTIHWATI